MYFEVPRPSPPDNTAERGLGRKKKEQVNTEGAAMNDTRISDQAIACLNLALERNKQLFTEAHSLSCAALDLLDRPYIDAEIFTQYQEQRRYADRKYREAIEHLRSIMTESSFSPSSAEIPIYEPPVSIEG
ncbi:hypothetical protein ACN1C3_30490 [Pseudomonas sp. H11T01]|uniref:hypothetical protein n=1 Tax=Pseudomonas sp. H11T01 TaxID=3402749 RepID=UPI003ACD6B5E